MSFFIIVFENMSLVIVYTNNYGNISITSVRKNILQENKYI